MFERKTKKCLYLDGIQMRKTHAHALHVCADETIGDENDFGVTADMTTIGQQRVDLFQNNLNNRIRFENSITVI